MGSGAGLCPEPGLAIRRPPTECVAVNVSATQFKHSDLLATVHDALQATRLAPQWLELEITETILMENVEAAASILRQLHQEGVRFAIDDFGTGYSSLSYLSRLHVDKLKIDQSFIHNLSTNPDAAAVANAIISLGHGLKMDVIAEGVEIKEDLDYLSTHGCDQVQGYYLGRPAAAGSVTEMLGNCKQVAGDPSPL